MKLAIGTAQFGMRYGVANKLGQVTNNEVKRILQTAKEAGIKMLDTAISYGESEIVLGREDIHEWNVITKIPKVPVVENIYSWIFYQLNNSLKNLGLKKIYGLLLHHPCQLEEYQGSKIWSAMEELKRIGKVQKLGVSIYSVEELRYVKDKKIDIIQSPVNILDRSLEKSGCGLELKQRGIEIHARSVFLQGVLLMTPNERPKFFSRWNNIFEIFDTWVEKNKISRLCATLNYVNSLPFVDNMVVGVDNNIQLKEILSALKMDFVNPPDFPVNDIKSLIDPSKWKNK